MSKSPSVPIFLIGMPGVGKSFLGKSVANKLNLPFVDLDNVIEQQIESTIADYIKTKGQEFFRVQEAIALRAIKIDECGIISSGGGCPCFHDNMIYMNLTGTTLFLDIPIDLLIERYKSQKLQRPLMNTSIADYLNQTSQSRRSHYLLANHTLPISNNAEQNIDNIISLIKTL